MLKLNENAEDKMREIRALDRQKEVVVSESSLSSSRQGSEFKNQRLNSESGESEEEESEEEEEESEEEMSESDEEEEESERNKIDASKMPAIRVATNDRNTAPMRSKEQNDSAESGNAASQMMMIHD